MLTHVDIRYHFVREHVVDDFIKIVFVKSCDNNADLFMKNVSKDTYTKQMNRVLDCITNILMDRVILLRLCFVEILASYV